MIRKLLTYLLLLHNTCLLLAQADSVVWQECRDTCRIRVTRLEINSAEEDFSPVLCGRKLIYTSARPASFGIIHKEAGSDRHTNIYYAEQKDSLQFSAPRLWPGPVNTHYNEGNLSVNKEETLLIYTGNERSSGKKEKNNLSLYMAKKINGDWELPEPVWFCKDGYSYCHPTLKNDGKTLFFSSDRPGGAGGMDIYCSSLVDGKWSEPQNVGTKVNSPYNEIFPMISESNNLYFSSNRPGGSGGLDIYWLNLDDPIDNELMIFESPVNSAADDFGIFADSSGESGYFSSSRNPAKKDDIYYFTVISPEFKGAPTPEVQQQFCYTFFEETAAAEPDTGGFEYEWKFGDGTYARGPKVKHCYTRPGTYSVELNVVEKNTGVLFYNQVSYEHQIPEPPQLKIECNDTLACSEKIRFSSISSSLPGYTIQKTYWNFGNKAYVKGKNVQYLFSAPGIYTITLGVIATNNASGQTEKFKLEKTVAVRARF